MTAYYNEIDPHAAQWLRNLITAGLIAPGDVDERDIRDVKPSELIRYTQCHFFAGIGIWSYALRACGWPDDKPVWTGSCPCQPFAAPGKGNGADDERHLWPHWDWLIQQCGPSEVFGEQVASPLGLQWFDLVSTDLENKGYAVAAADLCAAGCGPQGPESRFLVEASFSVHRCADLCPNPILAGQLRDFANDLMQTTDGGHHIRQRLYFYAQQLADTAVIGWQEQRQISKRSGERSQAQGLEQRSGSGSVFSSSNAGMVNGIVAGPQGQSRHGNNGNKPGWIEAEQDRPAAPTSTFGSMANAQNIRRNGGPGLCRDQQTEHGRNEPADDSRNIRLADSDSNRREETRQDITTTGDDGIVRDGSAGWLANGNGDRTQRQLGDDEKTSGLSKEKCQPINDPNVPERSGSNSDGPGSLRGNGLSSIGHNSTHAINIDGRSSDWLFCRDGKWRPVGPGTFPLAHKVAGRVGQLRAYGNGLDAETAKTFIQEVMEIIS